VSNGEPPAAQLLRCLRNAFAAYLDGSQGSLDKAFRLTRGRRGHPGADIERAVDIATAILDRRLAGENHETAIEKVSEAFGCGTTKAAESWQAHRVEAVDVLRATRAFDANGLTLEEWLRACEIADIPDGRSRWTSPKANS
jgi:hypothetical protein